MITQEIPISLLMEPQKNLIFRQGDFGNQIKLKFPDLTGITSAEFRLIKPDDTFVVSLGEIVENDILITITEQMSILSGYCVFNLRLINDHSNIYTYVGRALIDENINLDQYAESVAEVNGLVFPDDFLTERDLSQYATKTYVDDAIAEIPVYTPPAYSTAEQDTGLKWIDGNPIYQKTIEYLNTSVSLVALNIDTIVDIRGVSYLTDGTVFMLNTYAGDRYNTNIDITNNVLTVTMNGWALSKAYITIYYTKTTDTV